MTAACEPAYPEKLGTDRQPVFLITAAFPFPGGEDAFLPAELDVLSRRYDLTVIPLRRTPGSLARLPDTIRIDERLAQRMVRRSTFLLDVMRACVSPLLWRELASHRSLWVRPLAVLKVVKRLADTVGIASWTRSVLAPELRDGRAIVYCWWSAWTFVGVAIGLARVRIPVITRAHGFDLFAERSDVGFALLQEELLQRAVRVLSVSEMGARYLRAAHPCAADRVGVARLGTQDCGMVNIGSRDGVFRIVSCSNVVPVKRLHLLAQAVAEIARRRPDWLFLWTHIGAGPQESDLRKQVEACREIRGRVRLLGHMPHDQVIAYLASEPIDLFVNVSSSEGLPVSLMEAASFGIPMLATAVGGTPEIVGPAQSWLLPADVTPAMIADGIEGMRALGREKTNAIRAAARVAWESNFSAAVNYAEFADLLATVARNRR